MTELVSSPSSSGRTNGARPFLKWAGGKTQLLDEIDARLPPPIKESGEVPRYVEPFLGSGAVFFHLQDEYEVGECHLLDINREIMVGYRVVQRDLRTLIERLTDLEKRYLGRDADAREGLYYRVRNRYNEQISDFDYGSYGPGWIDRAAQLIFLNRTCYNGLFRQNQAGEFNVPHGQYANPTICQAKRLRRVHGALQDAQLHCASFQRAEQWIGESCFVYFDPPYLPLNETSNFTRYSKHDFGRENQLRLAEFYERMDQRGADLMLSNSDPKNEDPEEEFFDELYGRFRIHRVPAKRSINSKGDRRGEINELIITNYSA